MHKTYTNIIHYHLRKTAGTTINRWLDLTTSADRARPADYDSRFFAQLQASGQLQPPGTARDSQHGELGRLSRAYWQVIHGHSFGLVPADPHAYVFVILREPVDRYLSLLGDWRRCSESDIAQMPESLQAIRRDALHLDPSHFLLRHGSSSLLQSLSQAHALARVGHRLGTPVPPAMGPASSSPLAMACAALDRCFSFVGVYDDLPGALSRIAHDIGAAPPALLARLNPGLRERQHDRLTAEAERLLRTIWAADVSLYDEALRRFGRCAMPRYSESEFEDRHLAMRLAQLRPRFINGDQLFSIQDQVIGSGFHGRELLRGQEAVVWTGPSPRSLLYVPVPAAEQVDLVFDVAAYAHPSLRQALVMVVDGEPMELRRSATEAGAERLHCRVTTVRPFAKVELRLETLFSRDGVAQQPGSPAGSGLALRAYGFRLVSPWPLPEPSGQRSCLRALHPLCTKDERLALFTIGISRERLGSSPTAADVDDAFQRVLQRPAPPGWIAFWVGHPSASLERLYVDLIRSLPAA